MKKIRLGIYIEDSEYGDRLTCYFMNHYKDQLEIHMYTMKEQLEHLEGEIDIMLSTFEFLVKYISDNRKSLMNSEYLFTKLTGKNKGEPLDADSVYSMLKRLSKKTDINSHPHQLRHYFAEERRKEGWDLNDIRFALGHKKVETTIKYLGENNERLVEATDQYYSNNENLYQIADFL